MAPDPRRGSRRGGRGRSPKPNRSIRLPNQPDRRSRSPNENRNPNPNPEPKPRTRTNATQSGTSDKGLPAVGGDRALARVVAHLDLHGARVGSLRPARRENESQDLRAQPAQPLGDGARAVEAGVETEVLDVERAHHEADASRRE